MAIWVRGKQCPFSLDLPRLWPEHLLQLKKLGFRNQKGGTFVTSDRGA